MKVELKENIKFTTSNIPFAPSYKPGLVTKTQAGEMKSQYATQKSAMAVSFATCIAQMA